MAQVKFTAAVAEIRGKLNGNVFSRNTYGSYIRNKVTPINPDTADQIEARARLTTASQAWRGLTDNQRQGWQSLAQIVTRKNIFGDEVKLTGFNLYGRLNINLAKVGAAQITDAPSDTLVTPLLTLTLTAAETAQVLTAGFTPTPVPADHALLVRATPQLSAGITFAKNLYRDLQVVAAAGASPANISAAYVAKFGALVAGRKIFVSAYLVNISTGFESARLFTSDIVAA